MRAYNLVEFERSSVENRLSRLTLLNVHRDISVDILAVIDEFARHHPRRMTMVYVTVHAKNRHKSAKLICSKQPYKSKKKSKYTENQKIIHRAIIQ